MATEWYGIPPSAARTMLATILLIQFSICTGYGVSSIYYTTTETLMILGILLSCILSPQALHLHLPRGGVCWWYQSLGQPALSVSHWYNHHSPTSSTTLGTFFVLQWRVPLHSINAAHWPEHWSLVLEKQQIPPHFQITMAPTGNPISTSLGNMASIMFTIAPKSHKLNPTSQLGNWLPASPFHQPALAHVLQCSNVLTLQTHLQ